MAFVIERDGAILMLRRSRTKDHAPGEWEFGPGRLEYGEHPGEVEIIEPMSTFHFYRGAQREEGRFGWPRPRPRNW